MRQLTKSFVSTFHVKHKFMVFNLALHDAYPSVVNRVETGSGHPGHPGHMLSGSSGSEPL